MQGVKGGGGGGGRWMVESGRRGEEGGAGACFQVLQATCGCRSCLLSWRLTMPYTRHYAA